MPLDLTHLDAQQRDAVTAPDGAILVFAGAGSGKTRTLIARVAYLIEDRGVPASSIMAVTFTRKAAEEMRGRLVKMLGPEGVHGLRVGTFHAQMAAALRRESPEALSPIGRSGRFVIWDEDDRAAAVGLLLKARGIELPDGVTREHIGDLISRWKNDARTPGDPALAEDPNPAAVFARQLWESYEESLRRSDACDFDDLLGLPVALLEADADLRARWAGSIVHLLVDEFQDTNIIQLRLLELLSSVHHNLFVVGDDAQSIYRWRGARVEHILGFGTRYPRATKVILTTNYRSTAPIIEVANAILSQSKQNLHKQLRAAEGAPEGRKPAFHRFPDEETEAAFIAREAMELHAGGVGYNEMAVLVRTRAQTRALEAACVRNGISYKVVGGLHFYARKEVRDLLAWLRVIVNPRDALGWRRALGEPKRKIGERLVAAVAAVADSHGGDWMAAARVVAAGAEGTAAGRAALAEFADRIETWHPEADSRLAGLLVAEVLERSGLARSHDAASVEGVARLENLQEVINAASPYGQGGLGDFLEAAALEESAAERQSGDTLIIATLHAAKGLEWKVVWLAGAEEGLLPHASSLDDPAELEEERRLAYVGVTRARRRLTLTAAASRFVNGARTEQRVSRFVRDAAGSLRMAAPLDLPMARRPIGPGWRQRGSWDR